jgi:hypothetical protein
MLTASSDAIPRTRWSSFGARATARTPMRATSSHAPTRTARGRRDLAKAVSLARAACDSGGAEGCATFGVMTADGVGVKKTSMRPSPTSRSDAVAPWHPPARSFRISISRSPSSICTDHVPCTEGWWSPPAAPVFVRRHFLEALDGAGQAVLDRCRASLLAVSGQHELEALQRQWAELLRDEAMAVRLEYSQSGSTLIQLDSDGSLLVREHGGPMYHMGRLLNAEEPNVRAWRATIAPERHGILLASLREAGFPCGGDGYMLVPDEHPSSVTLQHSSGTRATMSAVHAAVRANVALHRVITELDGVCGALKKCPPTELLPNQERGLWRRLKEETLRFVVAGLNPEPSSEARERAQQAVERFYAERTTRDAQPIPRAHHDAAVPIPSIGGVVVQSERSPPDDPPSPRGSASGQASREEETTSVFTCRKTGLAAGTVALRLPHPPEASPSHGWLVLSGFAPTGNAEWRVVPDDFSALRAALVAGDARALWKRDPEIVPFFCPTCGACYAATSWQVTDVSASRVDGVCPDGHRRRLRVD